VNHRPIGKVDRMRVIDCNLCGETIRGADDDELARRLKAHYRGEHDEELADEDAQELVEGDAYEAMDS
jgi:predicted small metal-binding protein